MSLTTPLDPADLDTLILYLQTGGTNDPLLPDEALAIRDVSADPAALNLPGVLVQLTGVEFDRLAGVTIGVNLVCLAPELSFRAWPILADLWNRVTALVTPTGRASAVTMVLPDAPQAVPGLSIPFDLLTEIQETP